jgi:hypothetical protein
MHGGSLDTNLLELRSLTEGQATAWLQRAYGIANAIEPLTERPDPSVLGLLAVEEAVRYRAIPFRLDQGQLHVLLTDPLDAGALRELGSVSGYRIRPSVATELRLMLLLERHYGVPCGDRYRRLAALVGSEWSTGGGDSAVGAAPAPTADGSGPAPQRDPAGARSPSPGEPSQRSPGDLTRSVLPTFDWELEGPGPSPSMDSGLSSLHRGPLNGESPPRLGASAHVDARLAAASSHGAAAMALLSALEPLFARAILFALKRGAAVGWYGVGNGLTEGQVRDLRLPTAPQVSGGLSPAEQALAAGVYVGPYIAEPAFDAFTASLGGVRPRFLHISRIGVGERPLALLYLEAHRQDHLVAQFEPVQRWSALFGEALGRLILQSRSTLSGGDSR